MAGTHYTDAFSKRFSDPRINLQQPPQQLIETTHDESWIKYKQLLSELLPDEIDEDQTLMMSPDFKKISPPRNR